MPRHDVAIHAPLAGLYYDRAAPRGGGGAERQTYLLARSLAERGLRVAHIVHPVADREPHGVTLVETPKSVGTAGKAAAVWRALSAADARVQVFRGADGTLGVGGAWARAHRRRLVFAGANNSDFEGFAQSRDPRARMFAAGMRLADAVVVQSHDQVALARKHFPRSPAPIQINSFVEPAPQTDVPGEALLWVSRLVDYKRPLLFADLAAAVPEARFWQLPIRTSAPEYEATLTELERRAAQLDNLELVPQRPHAELQALIGRAVAMVNTSSFEGVPNTWLEGWARGVPALTYSFDPDGRIATHGLGIAAGGDWDAFVAGARELWAARDRRAGSAYQEYVATAHGTNVTDQWATLIART